MKKLKLLLLLCFFFIAAKSFAQTPKTIENNLLKSFKKIDYWENYIIQQRNINSQDEADNVVRASDSIEVANDRFGKKLKYYTEKYPFTIAQKFSSLIASGLDISTSDDGLFRIYSWDTLTGGTEHFFESVFQYKNGGGTMSILDTVDQSNYQKLYTMKVGDDTYYLAVYLFIESSRYYGEGIQCFSISQGKLSDDKKIIKTSTGLHSQIYYEADYGSVADWKVRPGIYYDAHTQTIHIPLVESKGKVTHRYITYKFTGQYFEKVKS